MKHSVNIILFFVILSFSYSAQSQPIWGRLSNPGFKNQYIKSTLFFAGNWRNGMHFYEYTPSDNTGLYTMHPSDSRHLGWSENIAYRNFAVETMIEAGVNVINMSYWGPRGTDNWAFWSPMQTSTYAHDELFDLAIGKNILVVPYIESFAATDSSVGYAFRDCFPGDILNSAPPIVDMIEDLIDRYLIHPGNEQWPGVWARAYDQDGAERYIVSLIHVASNQAGVDDQSFAAGFDWVADKVFDNTGVHVGFLLDALPVATYSPGDYKITPENADSWLAGQKSILGIQCFIPEIWTGYDTDTNLINWKRDYCQRWSNTSIPFIIDISPGYDAHIVFAESMIYGNNEVWRDSLSAIVEDIEADGITVNTWNGYTEGFAVVPTLEFGDASFSWITGLFGMYTIPDTITGFEETLSLTEEVCIYPNPIGQTASLEYRLDTETEISVRLMDMQGRVLETYIDNEKQNSGKHELTFSLPNGLSDGIYYITISSREGQTCMKIIK